jgi:hypothetical protein
MGSNLGPDIDHPDNGFFMDVLSPSKQMLE